MKRKSDNSSDRKPRSIKKAPYPGKEDPPSSELLVKTRYLMEYGEFGRCVALMPLRYGIHEFMCMPGIQNNPKQLGFLPYCESSKLVGRLKILLGFFYLNPIPRTVMEDFIWEYEREIQDRLWFLISTINTKKVGMEKGIQSIEDFLNEFFKTKKGFVPA